MVQKIVEIARLLDPISSSRVLGNALGELNETRFSRSNFVFELFG